MRRGVLTWVGLLASILLIAPPAFAEPYAGNESWYVGAMRLAEAQELSDGSGVTVGVIDTGVDGRHPDLAGRVLPGVTVTDTGTETGGDFDPDGHGTAMAGLIAGTVDNGDPLTGVAPGARILPVRVERGDDGTLDTDLVYRGVRWAIEHGATVINLSLAGKETEAADWKGDLLRLAIAHDAVIVAAVGNRHEGSSEVGEPASIPGVIAVSGLGRDGDVWPGSVTGDEVVVCAPAEELPHIRPDGEIEPASGTSAATALVSGTAALIQSRYPGSSAGEVVERLIDTAADAGEPGRDPEFGYGTVDAFNALAAAVPPNKHYFPLALPPDEPVAAPPSGTGAWWFMAPVGATAVTGGGISVWLLRRSRHRPATSTDLYPVGD